MQLTARQREFARIAGWALPVSVTLGAIFGHLQAPNDGVRGYVHGAIAGILISTTILLLEFAIFRRTRSALARRLPFLLYLTVRSLGYLASILIGLAVSAWLMRESAESEIFSLVLSVGPCRSGALNMGASTHAVSIRSHRVRRSRRVG
jgi:hypothetical protein